MSQELPPQKPITAALVIVGNEILSGRTSDANLPYAAAKLNGIGIRLMEVRVVRDDADAIVEAVNACRTKYDYVFTTGGIGPTHDDITAEAVARAFGLPLVRNPQAVALLKRRYAPAGLNEARLSMAEMPQGAVLIDNPVSGAPGFQIGNVFVLAGVPSIMQAMLDGLLGGLAGGAPLRSHTVSCHLAEGAIAEGLSALQRRFPGVEIGSYPFFRAGRFGASLVLRAVDETILSRAAEELRALIEELGGEPFEDDPA
jgi:molybdenum cofactor synthesis domain-containing protein